MIDSDNEDLGERTCRTCACSYLVKPPAVPTAEQLRADPQLAHRPAVLICRLNPPVMMMTRAPGSNEPVAKPMQPPTEPHVSCWSWKAPGTLPGTPSNEPYAGGWSAN
jgi:hypothetical protein